MALLEIKDLTIRFGGLAAVSEFECAFEGGELMGLIGPNGAGKTTVFNMVSGFYRPTGGSIVFDGTPTAGLKPHQVTALGIARTFQNIRLWKEMSVLDNIRVAQYYRLGYGVAGCFFRSRRYMTREAEIERTSREVIDALELTRYTDERPTNLPYGLQRRVEIARALSLRPKLLLLDEPAAGLNSADVEGLISLIRWVHEEYKLSIWMIEHQMKVVMSLCQWIKVIDFGRIIAEGTPEQIQANPEVIKAYLGDENI